MYRQATKTATYSGDESKGQCSLNVGLGDTGPHREWHAAGALVGNRSFGGQRQVDVHNFLTATR